MLEKLLSSECVNLAEFTLQTMDPRLLSMRLKALPSQEEAPSWGVSRESA